MYVCEPFVFKNFGIGVYTNKTQCSETETTHTALVVGYGENENGDEYWELLNSYGEEWGFNGTIRYARNTEWDRYGGQNGILEKPMYNVPSVYRFNTGKSYQKKALFDDWEPWCRSFLAYKTFN